MDISTEFNTAIKTLHKEIYKRINSGVQTTSGKNLIRIGVLFDIEQFINVGTFGTLEEAINARILAVRERHGEFANVTL